MKAVIERRVQIGRQVRDISRQLREGKINAKSKVSISNRYKDELRLREHKEELARKFEAMRRGQEILQRRQAAIICKYLMVL